MKIGFGRYRLRIALKDRTGSTGADRLRDGDRTDHDLALLAQAEREYHETLWKPQSILNGPGQ
jgi:hypothetical protein